MRVWWIVAALLLVGIVLALAWRDEPESFVPPAPDAVVGEGRLEDRNPESMAVATRDVVSAEDPPAAEQESGTPSFDVLKGVVADVTGTPIAGARIVLSRRGGEDDSPAFRHVLLTSAYGTFEASVPPPSSDSPANRVSELEVEASAPGYITHSLNVRPPYGALTITLPRALRLVGTVLEEDTRAPVAGASVRLLQTVLLPAPLASTSTDTGGRFEFENLPEGRVLSLRIHRKGWQWCSHSIGPATPEPGTTEARVEVVVSKGEQFEFLAVDALTQVPVPDATFAIEGIAWGSTDAAGRVTLQGVTAAFFTSDVRAGGYCAAGFKLKRDGAERPVRVPLVPACTIEGVVRDEYGRPRPSVYVYGSSPNVFGVEHWAKDHPFDSFAYHTVEGVLTDENGFYRLEGLPASPSPFALCARKEKDAHQTGRIASEVAIERPGTVVVMDIVLPLVPTTGALTGLVTLDGKRTRARIVVIRGDQRREVETDDEGRFTILDLPVGTNTVEVEADAATWSREFEIEPDGIAWCVAKLESAPSVFTRGSVLDEHGAPIHHVAVDGVLAGEKRTALTQEGVFEFKHYAPVGTLKIAYRDRWQEAQVEVLPGSQDAVLRVRRVHPIRMVLRGEPARSKGTLEWRDPQRPGAGWQAIGEYGFVDRVSRLTAPAGPLDLRFIESGSGRIATLQGVHPERKNPDIELHFELP